MKKLLFTLLMAVPALAQSANDRISLAGTWQFATDERQLVHPDYLFTETVQLPGTTDTNRKGHAAAVFTETTHLTRHFSYKGRAWYKREVVIPADWQGQRVSLFLERTKPTEVYVDCHQAGASNDISTPQVYDLMAWLTPGRHQLAVMVDNGSGVPEQIYANSHAYTEDTQTNWNGIIGEIYLQAGTLLPTAGREHPATGKGQLEVRGHHFYQNGHRIFLRGRHDACVWPLTGHVPMDVESWREYMQTCLDYGLNHVRFHSWCPPEAAFVAADEAGIILQPELPFWGDFNAADTTLMTFLHKEGENILRWYGHHPSFRMFALGNELWGSVEKMGEFVSDFRRIAPDKLYTFGSNYYLGYQGVKPGMDYFTTCRVGGEAWGTYSTHTRGSFSFADAFDGGMINHFRPNATMNFAEGCARSTVPVISHETAQFQTYPDYNEIKKYTGVLYPYNLEVFRQRLDKAGMLTQAEAFYRASGQWSLQLYKQDIEMDLRTPNMAGFQLLDLQDYPGQGSAYVGILDAFLDSKGMCTVRQWREWCNDVVPLLVSDAYCLTTDEGLHAKVQVANYSGQSLRGRTLTWTLDEQSGTLTLPDGEGLLDAGTLDIDLTGYRQPTQTLLALTIEGTEYHNTYDLWVYPAKQKLRKGGLIVTRQLTDDIARKLERGARVLWMPDSAALGTNTVGPLFQTDYWNYRMFKTISENNKKTVSPGTMGILCNPGHPLFRLFPTQEHSNWQWYAVVSHSRPLIMDGWPAGQPLVQVIDNIERNHRLGLMVECAVGKGRLLIAMSDLEQAAQLPEGRQFYASLLDYMRSADFAPTTRLTLAELRTLLSQQTSEVTLDELNNISPY